jgi:hypothetical protein
MTLANTNSRRSRSYRAFGDMLRSQASEPVGELPDELMFSFDPRPQIVALPDDLMFGFEEGPQVSETESQRASDDGSFQLFSPVPVSGALVQCGESPVAGPILDDGLAIAERRGSYLGPIGSAVLSATIRMLT